MSRHGRIRDMGLPEVVAAVQIGVLISAIEKLVTTLHYSDQAAAVRVLVRLIPKYLDELPDRLSVEKDRLNEYGREMDEAIAKFQATQEIEWHILVQTINRMCGLLERELMLWYAKKE